jgi:AcrR family transcriptional regulator
MAIKNRAPVSATAPKPTTRELILDEAERLIALKGVFGFGLKDITDPLGFQVPAIYKHYENRDDVLVAVSRRYIALLSRQFRYPAEAVAHPTEALKHVVAEFVQFHMRHPAYVRLSLVDYATPEGGMEYIRRAAGGPFRANLNAGPLAPMHRRLRKLIRAGHAAGEFRLTSELDFYRVIKAALLIRLVFPDDLLVDPSPKRSVVQSIEVSLWDTAYHYIAAPPSKDFQKTRGSRA